jgi:hypothetical protein
MRFAIAGDHRTQAEPLELMLQHGYAHNAAAVANHHVDRLRGRLGGRHDQIPLIFTILVVRHDHQLAFVDVLHDGLDTVERGCGKN